MITLRNSKTGETVTIEPGQRDGYPTKAGWRKLPKRMTAAKPDKETERQNAIRAMSRVELFDFFDQRIKELERRIEAEKEPASGRASKR